MVPWYTHYHGTRVEVVSYTCTIPRHQSTRVPWQVMYHYGTYDTSTTIPVPWYGSKLASYHGRVPWYQWYHGISYSLVLVFHGTWYVRTYSGEGSSESVGVCGPAFAPSQLAAVYPSKTNVVLGAHVCPVPIRKL